jgi:sterol desaturase/sphingolipid hydroxylase (fatty acid hydroxylase superfamily)
MPTLEAAQNQTETQYVEYSPHLLRRLVSYLSYPLIMGSIMGSMIWSLNNQADAATPLFVACMMLAPLSVWLLERLQPHCLDWYPTWIENVRTDIATVLVNGGLAALISEPLRLTLFAVLGSALATWLPWSLWPKSLPLALQFCIALLAADLGSYWYHRKMHEWQLGWRFHSVHHSSNRLYWLNAPRFHYVDITLYNLSATLPLVALGAPAECFVLVALFSACHGYFQHANFRVHLGPMNYIFSMAELHRWHHSKDMALANHNYGNNTIVWDWVFGTFFWPRERIQASDDIGPGPDMMPSTFRGLLLAPFKRLDNQPGTE